MKYWRCLNLRSRRKTSYTFRNILGIRQRELFESRSAKSEIWQLEVGSCAWTFSLILKAARRRYWPLAIANRAAKRTCSGCGLCMSKMYSKFGDAEKALTGIWRCWRKEQNTLIISKEATVLARNGPKFTWGPNSKVRGFYGSSCKSKAWESCVFFLSHCTPVYLSEKSMRLVQVMRAF